MKRTPRQIIGLVMLGSGLLLTTLGVLSLVFAVPVYQATARIWIGKNSQPDLATPSTTNAPAFDPNWVQTEVKRIQSKLVLHSVITNLDLRVNWAGKRGMKTLLSLAETYRLLERRIGVTTGRGTTLFQISSFSEDPIEAALIANTIAEVYRDHGNAKHKGQRGALPTEPVQIIDSAEPPSRPSRERNPVGLFPVMLFAGAMVSLFTGYFLMRPVANTGIEVPSASGQ